MALTRELRSAFDGLLNERMGDLILKIKVAITEELMKKIDEIKESVDAKLDKVLQNLNKTLQDKEERIQKLETEVASCKRTLSEQEVKLTNVEQAEVADQLIITQRGLTQSASSATDKERILSSFRSELRLNVSPNDITWTKRMGKINTSGTDNRPILFKVPDKEKRVEILNACKTVKPNFYVNEDLCYSRRLLMKTLRDIRKVDKDKLQVLFVKNGVIHARTNQHERMHYIRTSHDLNDFITNNLS